MYQRNVAQLNTLMKYTVVCLENQEITNRQKSITKEQLKRNINKASKQRFLVFKRMLTSNKSDLDYLD